MKLIMKKYRYLFFLSVIISLMFSITLTLFSLELGNIIDAIKNNPDILVHKLLLALLFLIISILFLIIYSYISNKFTTKILNNIKKNLYENYYNIQLKDYNKSMNAEYLNLFTKDMDLLIDNYLKPKLMIFTEIFRAVFAIVAIIYISWRLAIALTFISIINILLSSLPSRYMLKKTNKFSEENKKYLDNTTNYISGFEQIKLLNIKEIFISRLNILDDKFEVNRYEYLFSKDFSGYFAMSLGLISQVLCLSVGVFLAIKGYLTIGMLIAAIQLLNSIFTPISNISKYKNLIKTQKKIIENIDIKLNDVKYNLSNLDNKVSEIKLKNISLNFDNKKIFDNFSYTFKADTKYVIIGESGKGKSTLIRLIMKYFNSEKYNGNITINGEDISKINDDNIYSKIAYIQKNEFILNESIENNILLDRKKYLSSNLLKMLNLNEFINKKERNTFSFGEKQRIDIARFIINDYDVYIFDEPTSNLDPKTSESIYDYIFSLKDKIIIVITHNQNDELLSKFDEIIELK